VVSDAVSHGTARALASGGEAMRTATFGAIDCKASRGRMRPHGAEAMRSEALLRQLLCRRRRSLGLSRGELRRLADGFDSDSLRAAPECSAPALAFVLASMYWCGCRHPRSLFIAPLHPPTGLVRWLTRFCVQEQVDQGQLLLERLVLEVQRIDLFAGVLMRRIQAMTARHGRRVVLLPDLLRIAESVNLHEGGSMTTRQHEESGTCIRA
jgi:hypothetical protein